MNAFLFAVIAAIETAIVGGLFLLYPRFARRGLLFGVYVGEERWSGDEARQLTRTWYRDMVLWLAGVLLAEVTVGTLYPSPAILGFAPLLLVAGFVLFYVRAYLAARAFAVETPPQAVALVQATPEASLLLPFTALVVGVVAGAIAIGYAAANYAALPARVPTHFGPSGAPDAWRPKGFFSVMLLPLMTLLMGIGMGAMSILTAKAKRAVRYPNTETSLEAQLRFRTAVTRMTSTISLLISIMLALMSIASIRVGLGVSQSMPWPVLAITGLVMVVALGGSLYIGLRYGQGGARWERQASSAPLTNGLADNRHWVLGSFYVNRDDPSYLVEHRFGLGYTLNLGNWKAVAVVVGFIGTLLALVLLSVIFM